ncbi:MAG: hypothetical protein AAF716_20280 [Cyanobacteria bacterium P01_D01_bin.1]
MKTKKTCRMKQLGLAIAATFITVGCTDSPMANKVASKLLANNLAQVNAAELTADTSSEALSAETTDVEFEICAAVDSWQRPSDAEQAKQLGEDSRYATALDSDDSENSLKMASSQFWDHQVISFTTYGLSARMEPVNLSGLWTVEDQLLGCYEPEATMAINEGDRAEAWLLNQQITSLEWDGTSYVMTVEPSSTGMQVVQFNRMDSSASLPLTVVTDSGLAIEVASGDWQEEEG